MESCKLVMELSELVMKSLDPDRIFNAARSFSIFEIRKYYQNEPNLSNLNSQHNLPCIMKNRTYVVNLDAN